ncbi:MAG: VOC family protein [Polaromonas sp.]|nr:VOC family protein [Polaromonas sp.]
MLANRNAMATIAVRNLAAARDFYQRTLGLELADSEQSGVLAFHSGASTLVIYESAYAGSNQATSATWSLGSEFDEVMHTLQAAGVKFEHYDLPGLVLEGDAHVHGDFRGAWFKDPDGNILHIMNQ